jgi:glycosyltransferase involved in cell wall biosynthesis
LESFAGMALVFCQWIYPSGKRLLTLQSTNTSFLLGVMHRAAQRITAISSVLVERAKQFGRTDVTLIPNGIPLDAISKACAAHKKEASRILFVGRLERMKGIDVLINSMSRLPKDLPYSLHIVGDGSQRRSIEALVQELGLSDKVTMHGYLSSDALYAEFAKAGIFCGLSRSEALGNVFLEAQAAGCSVIATNTGGIPDSVKDGETGVLVSVNSVEEAAKALEKCLRDEAFKKVIAEAGRKNAEKYDWRGIAEKYEGIYKEMVN